MLVFGRRYKMNILLRHCEWSADVEYELHVNVWSPEAQTKHHLPITRLFAFVTSLYGTLWCICGAWCGAQSLTLGVLRRKNTTVSCTLAAVSLRRRLMFLLQRVNCTFLAIAPKLLYLFLTRVGVSCCVDVGACATCN